MDPASLFVSLMVGTIGFALLIYGKKQQRIPQLGVGLVMMVYPYFVSSAWISGGIAVVLLGLMSAAIHFGM